MNATNASLPDPSSRDHDRDDVEHHVIATVFDSSERPDENCSLCRAGVDLGVWRRFGFDDPFAVEDEE